MAVAAYLVGRDEESARAWERASVEWTRSGNLDRAARCGFWLGFGLLLRGETAQASGWLARAGRLVDDAGGECAAAGYLQVVAGLEAMEQGDPDRAAEIADGIMHVAKACEDGDLWALGLLCGGQAALAAAPIGRGMALLDEAMVAVAGGEVSPLPAGIVYCAVVEACMVVFDLRRAAEWTEALERWCGTQPDLVPYRGRCPVHRSQLLQAHGAWPEALTEAERACRWLSQPTHPALGLALYQRAGLHRLQGRLGEAERAYRAASRHGCEPASGLALLWLAESRVAAALATIRRMVEESRGRLTRPAMLAASVEILLAADEAEEARSTADELCELADVIDAPLLHASADYATGSVLLAEGDPRAALGGLRRAHDRWRDLERPYDAARARVRVVRTHHAPRR